MPHQVECVPPPDELSRRSEQPLDVRVGSVLRAADVVSGEDTKFCRRDLFVMAFRKQHSREATATEDGFCIHG